MQASMSPAQLDDRSTIRANGARRQVDAFREIRARLFSNAQPNPVILIAPVSEVVPAFMAGCSMVADFISR